MKKLQLTAIALSALLFTACGSDDSTIDDIKVRNGIEIYHNMPSGECNQASFQLAFENPSFYELTNATSCATFDRSTTSDYKGSYCREFVSERGGDKACVIAFDDLKAYYRQTTADTNSPYIITDGQHLK